MFKRSFRGNPDRAGKARKISKRSFRDDAKQRMRDALNSPQNSPCLSEGSPSLSSAIVTLSVGPEQRTFAAHEDVLSRSPYMADILRTQFFEPSKRITFPDEEPEVFSAILEYLYKGDYQPRLLHDKRRDTWSLEDDGLDPPMTPHSVRTETTTNTKKTAKFNELATIFHRGVGDYILRDTVIYCSALRFGLPDLQRRALRKQGLQADVDVPTILRSARFAYANTPASDSRLRSHYLKLIIRSRKTFKKSGTLQMEMEKGGSPMFFDLFVTLVNHIDDLTENGTARSSLIDK